MIIDPIRRIPAGQVNAPPAHGSVHQMAKHLQIQQQIEQEHQKQVLLQQQLDNERLERERQELERFESMRQESQRQEIERQELERQEIARQHAEHQELHRQQEFRLRELQRQQQSHLEAVRRQEQETLRRQQERAEQLQRQEQYRQQLEFQQRQLEEQRSQMAQFPHFQFDSLANVPPSLSTRQMPPSHIPNSAPILRQLSHSKSASNLSHQAQQQISSQSMDQITPQQTSNMPVPAQPIASGVSQTQQTTRPYYQTSMSHTQIISQHTTTSTHVPQIVSQPQHSMYAIPRTEFLPPDSINPTPGYTPQTSYVQSHSSVGLSSSQVSPVTETYRYWPAAATMAVDQPTTLSMSDLASQTSLPQHHHRYTPEGALRGIAADDRSLQETWQSYMNKVLVNVLLRKFSCLIQYEQVGSPRQFLED